MPSLTIERLCRLLDANGDGSVDFREFAALIDGTSDDVSGKSSSALTRRLERNKFMKAGVTSVDGRFGATPAFSYGTQARELIGCYPGCPGYISEGARFSHRNGR